MERLVLTAYITVSLQEEAASSKPPDKPAPQPPLALDRFASENVAPEQHGEGKAKEKELDVPAITNEDESSSDEYRCKVMEEPLSPTDTK